MKKAITIFWICFFVLCFVWPCAAEESFSLTPGKDFAVYGKDSDVSERLQMTEAETQEFCRKNDIVYLAVNADNTRQIRLSISQTDFAASVGHLSGLSDEKILSLMPELTGEDRGEIVKKDGQKFIRQNISLHDSGGDYLLTRYITVAAQKYYVLSFYTQSGADTAYAQEVFEGFTCADFEKPETQEKSSLLQIVIPVFIVLFSLGAGGIVFLLIRDIRKQTVSED